MGNIKRDMAEKEREAEDLKNEFGIGMEEEEADPDQPSSPGLAESALSRSVMSVDKPPPDDVGPKRLWVWEGYIAGEKREEWEQLADDIQRVNITV
jgi:hypothetical protein